MSCETIPTFDPVKFGETWGPKIIQVENKLNLGTYLDLTGYTILIQLRKRPDQKVFHVFETSVSGTEITMEPNGWDVDIPDFTYQGDVLLTDPSGFTYLSNSFLLPVGNSITKS